MRRSGQTTRLVDSLIQVLFKEGSVIIVDHYPGIEGRRCAKDVLIRRLQMEHQGIQFEIDRKNEFLITLK